MPESTRSDFNRRGEPRGMPSSGICLVLCSLLVTGLGFGIAAKDENGEPATGASVEDRATRIALPDQEESEKVRLPEEPTVLLIGDSFSLGHGAEPRAKGYAFLLAERMGWQNFTVDGVGKTGFISGGDFRYLERLNARIRSKAPAPDLVVLQGSVNDTWIDYHDMLTAVTDTVRTIETHWPGTEIVLTTPITHRDFAREERALHVAARSTRAVLLIDEVPRSWLPPVSNLYIDDSWHPSTQGHARIAESMGAALQDRIRPR
ncbi:SGNH/GDSL hydrolase family protein [Kocuria sp. M4R2S49]|uniref:SGNH/GDSL hydrolase family protein n=1 Tax=Kocuria rhizosphaericola TaxID=3376284 RepID=UPI0037B688F2